MKSNLRWMVVLAVIAGVGLNGPMKSMAASKEADEATTMMKSYEAQQKAAAAAREKDPAWKPSCDEVGLIQIGDIQPEIPQHSSFLPLRATASAKGELLTRRSGSESSGFGFGNSIQNRLPLPVSDSKQIGSAMTT